MLTSSIAITASAAYALLLAVVLGIGARHGGLGWELASFGLTLAFPLVLLVTVAHAIGGWARHQARALLPVALLLGGVPGIAGVNRADGAFHEFRFLRHRGELEAVVGRSALSSGGRAWLPLDSLPAGVRDCCARVVVRRDSVGRLSAMFIANRRMAYLYDPGGTRLQRRPGSRWRSHERLAQDWYRVTR